MAAEAKQPAQVSEKNARALCVRIAVASESNGPLVSYIRVVDEREALGVKAPFVRMLDWAPVRAGYAFRKKFFDTYGARNGGVLVRANRSPSKGWIMFEKKKLK